MIPVMETIRTPEDCAKCELLRYCDAHITGGIWDHRAGVVPCKVVVEG